MKDPMLWSTLGLVALISICTLNPKITSNYREGVHDTHIEAFNRGYMIKEIIKDDKVIYKWKDSK